MFGLRESVESNGRTFSKARATREEPRRSRKIEGK
jgi:hypothetical protein